MIRSTSLRIGFSLVELMVTVGLIAILSGAGFATTLRSNEQKRITESAETIRQYFVQAKSLALAGKKDCTACGSSSGVCGSSSAEVALSGWETTLSMGPPVTLEMHGECGSTNFFSTGVKTMPSSIRVNASRTVIFYPLNNGTNLSGDRTITVSSSTTGLTSKSFVITRQGEIRAIQ